MRKSALSRPDPLRLAIAAILVLTLWRLALLPFSRLELYVDEAQYWLWGQEMTFGAYSKPPLVGWMIRAANRITGRETVDVSITVAGDRVTGVVVTPGAQDGTSRGFQERFAVVLRDRPLRIGDWERHMSLDFDSTDDLYAHLRAVYDFLFETGPFPEPMR